jgi:hypothetical protein
LANQKNAELIFQFHEFMKENRTSERHQNNNRALLKYGIGQSNIFKLLDEEDHELCICKFIQKYYKLYLNQYLQYDENCIYSNKIFRKQFTS